MPFEKGQHPGATWRKSDLQCHSPRDRNWQGPENLPGGTAANEQARRDWAKSFIDECRNRKLEVIAVTDHHDMGFVPYVVDAADVVDFPILFPGVEVTCNDNTQCLVLFDPASSPELWSHFLGKLAGIQQSDPVEAKTAPTKLANMTIRDLFEAVAKDSRLKDNCVILPHFSDGDAHKHLNEDGHHERFATLECDGVYIEKQYAQLEEDTVKKVYGLIQEWGTRRRAIVATGDNRTSGWDRLGIHECWIKLGENTIEAVRQALLADEARISYTQPEIPSERIVTLTVLSSLTGDEAVSVSLNEGFNALIGGRGSGKSALLEYLRFGLGRTNRDLARDDDPFDDGFDRDVQLIEETLGHNGYIKVTIEREGVTETWYRDLENRDTIQITNEDDTETEITIGDAQRRFRARAFYQKGLSTTMNNSGSAAEQITSIAAAEQLDQRREIDGAIDRAKRHIGTTIRRQSSLWQIQLEKRRVEALVADVKRRIAAVAARMEKDGLKPEALSIIGMAPIYKRAKNYQGQVNRVRSTDYQRIEAVKNNLLSVTLSQFEGVDAFDEIKSLDAALADTRVRVAAHLDSALAEFNKFGEAYVASLGAFGAREEAYQQQYQAALAAQSAHKQLIEEHARLTAELKKAEEQELEIAEQEAEIRDASAQFTETCEALDKLIRDRAAVLTLAARKVEGQSSQLLKAKHKRDPIPEEYVAALLQLLSGARVHDSADKTKAWVSAVVPAAADPNWPTVRGELLSLYKAKIEAGSPSEPSEEHAAAIQDVVIPASALTPQQIQKIFQNLSDEVLANIFAAAPRDYIVLTYVDQGRDVPFEQASPGQQASALLELLLRQSAGTLIIDQPEDDLDNRVIMKIVNLIKISKSTRQLLFATHNPNIVVNGDADKVIALKSGENLPGRELTPRVQIDVDGAIETPEVRNAITHVMEGGKEAFDLRSRKYNFQT